MVWGVLYSILLKCGCGGIGIRARLRGVWLCLASSSLAIRIIFYNQKDGIGTVLWCYTAILILKR